MKKNLFIAGISILVVGIVLTGAFYGKTKACQGTVAQIAGFFDPSITANCGTSEFFLYTGIGLLIIGLTIAIVGLVLKK